jgi:Tubulin like
VRPYLIVGCGGSGGVTLQFLMDQLKADLALKGIDKLPAAWQFVHIDVPQSPDGVKPGIPLPVPQQSPTGRYIGIAQPGSTFGSVTASLTDPLIAQRRLTQLGAWQADPRVLMVPITAGAGQMRAVGRVVTLSGIGRIREGLQAALTAMTAAGSRGELTELVRKISPGSEALADSAPVVLVVSSMAGGAGASMVLDVCRLLSQEPAVSPALTALFLYTPEIFDSIDKALRNGVPGNALAMTGELIASQLGAAAVDDVEILTALGQGIPNDAQQAPFGRVIPIGARIGETGALFADGHLDSIYRGVGRGLAALMQSASASTEWISYDLTNSSARADELEHFGWSSAPDKVQWGSFGFAQLSMGRDRYAEYAAQRIARAAVVRLVSGHSSPSSPGTDLEQLNRLADERFPGFLADLGLPGREGPQQWFRGVLGNMPNEGANVISKQHLEPLLALTQAVDAGQWFAYVDSSMRNRAPALTSDARQAAYDFVYGWYNALLERTARAVEATVATDGLPTALALLERAGRDVDSWAQQLREGARLTPQDPTTLPAAVAAQATALKGSIDARHAIVQTLRTGYGGAIASTIAGEAAAKLGEIFTALRSDFLGPLAEACSDALTRLQMAVDTEVTGGGLAQLRTNEYPEWPSGDQPVPTRFTHAQNEVLLIDASTFQGQFDAHLIETVRTDDDPSPTPLTGLGTALREVVLHQWATVGAPPPGHVLARIADWRPAALDRDPGKPERVPSRRGQYRLAVTPAELLARSRQWVLRPRLPFEKFIKTSLRDYVAAGTVPDTLRVQRTTEIMAKFRDTLELAQPLVAINRNLATALHPNSEATVVYKFSDVPFGALIMGDDLVHDLEQRRPDQRSVLALKGALKPVSDATRIDVFGSFAPLSPLAFSSLLGPLATGWASLTLPKAREVFWSHRRSRRLAGGVAMNDGQRRAMIGGWFVARYTGRLRLPGESHAQDAVQIYDDRLREWISFPNPLVVPQIQLDGKANNYLPAVILSFGLAMARVGATGSLEPLKPYTLLRKYWDDSTSGRAGSDSTLLTAATRLAAWARGTAAMPEGAVNTVEQSGDPEKNRQGLLSRFTTIRDRIGEDYLRPGYLGARGGGRYSVIDRAEDLFDLPLPLYHEAAEDAFRQLGILVDLLGKLDLTSDGDTGADDGDLI